MADAAAGSVALPTNADDARAAVDRSARKLAAARARWPAVHRVAARLDASRDPDELAAKISQAYRSM